MELALDADLIRRAAAALPDAKSQTPQPVVIQSHVRNVNRAVGTQLSYEVCMVCGPFQPLLGPPLDCHTVVIEESFHAAWPFCPLVMGLETDSHMHIACMPCFLSGLLTLLYPIAASTTLIGHGRLSVLARAVLIRLPSQHLQHAEQRGLLLR